LLRYRNTGRIMVQSGSKINLSSNRSENQKTRATLDSDCR